MHLSPCNYLWIRSQAALHQHKHLTSHTNWLPISANAESRLSVSAVTGLAQNITFKCSSICLLLCNEINWSQDKHTWAWSSRCKCTQQSTHTHTHTPYAERVDYKTVQCFCMPSPWGGSLLLNLVHVCWPGQLCNKGHPTNWLCNTLKWPVTIGCTSQS